MNLEKLQAILDYLKNEALKPMTQSKDLEIKILEALLDE